MSAGLVAREVTGQTIARIDTEVAGEEATQGVEEAGHHLGTVTTAAAAEAGHSRVAQGNFAKVGASCAMKEAISRGTVQTTGAVAAWTAEETATESTTGDRTPVAVPQETTIGATTVERGTWWIQEECHRQDATTTTRARRPERVGTEMVALVRTTSEGSCLVQTTVEAIEKTNLTKMTNDLRGSLRAYAPLKRFVGGRVPTTSIANQSKEDARKRKLFLGSCLPVLDSRCFSLLGLRLREAGELSAWREGSERAATQ